MAAARGVGREGGRGWRSAVRRGIEGGMAAAEDEGGGAAASRRPPTIPPFLSRWMLVLVWRPPPAVAGRERYGRGVREASPLPLPRRGSVRWPPRAGEMENTDAAVARGPPPPAVMGYRQVAREVAGRVVVRNGREGVAYTRAVRQPGGCSSAVEEEEGGGGGGVGEESVEAVEGRRRAILPLPFLLFPLPYESGRARAWERPSVG